MNDAEIKLQVKVDSGEAEKKISSLSDKTNSLATSFKNAGKKMTVGLTLPITALIGVGIKYNATVEQLTTSFEVMTGSAKEAGDIVERLKKIGSKTPFEFTDLAETTKLLMNYGLTADDAIDKMQMLGDISQGNADKMNRISMAYGQMSSAGKVNLEDIKQMIEAGFNPLKEISDSTGETMLSLYDRISKGKISVDEITKSMERSTKKGGKYFQSMEKQSQTVEGRMSTLKDEFMSATGTLTVSLLPAFTSLVKTLTSVAQWFSNLSEGQKKTILTVLGVIAVLGPLVSFISTLITVVSLISKGVAIFNAVLLANPIVLIIVAIIALIAAIVLMIKHWDTVSAYLTKWWGYMKQGFVLMGQAIISIFKGIGNAFIGLINLLITGLNMFIKNALAPLNLLIKGINIPLKALGLKTVSQIKFEIPKIPKLAIGTDKVHKDGLAFLHKDEKVVPASVAKGGYSGAGNKMTLYIQQPNIELNGRVVSRELTPYITQTVKLGGGNV